MTTETTDPPVAADQNQAIVTEADELIATLKERYGRPPQPTCRLCGGPMTPGFMGEGRIEWYCDGPAGEWMGMEEGPAKKAKEDHYSWSKHIQTRGGDSDVLRLIARVEAFEEFARDVRDNYDCDSDAHKYGTRCRCCEAETVLLSR